MARPTKSAKRRNLIIAQLADLSRDGWSRAKPCDYEPLEAELSLIDAFLAKVQQ